MMRRPFPPWYRHRLFNFPITSPIHIHADKSRINISDFSNKKSLKLAGSRRAFSIQLESIIFNSAFNGLTRLHLRSCTHQHPSLILGLRIYNKNQAPQRSWKTRINNLLSNLEQYPSCSDHGTTSTEIMNNLMRLGSKRPPILVPTTEVSGWRVHGIVASLFMTLPHEEPELLIVRNFIFFHRQYFQE